MLAKSINMRLFSIKRLFYLPFNIKLQFFKTFILPLFDYSLSLIIYYSKNAINRVFRKYYDCLFKLFKFEFLSQSPIQINNFLTKYGLNSFHHRILFKFAFNTLNNETSPIYLKINLAVSSEQQRQAYDPRKSTKNV